MSCVLRLARSECKQRGKSTAGTAGVHKSEKKEVCRQPTVEARARARDGSRSRWGALAEQGEAGSGLGRLPLPYQCGLGAIAPVSRARTARADLILDQHVGVLGQ
jgi:hypothetical protein